MRKKIIAANWKMYMTVTETENFYRAFSAEVPRNNRFEILIAPPATALAKLSELNARASQRIRLAAQNMFYEESGAYTGEISPTMLRELFVQYVLLGHSERRQIFGESDVLIARKVRAALHYRLCPILCIGETRGQRDAGKEKEVLEHQLRVALQEVESSKLESIVVAYEPVWAIGAEQSATPEQAQQSHTFIRCVLTHLFDAAIAVKIPIQYGGNVHAANVVEFLSQPDIDGVLVGRASLEARKFADIIKAANELP
ncbi:MAG: triose-phosphate isomerase [Candidatus Xiphinematobacter sp.]|nr:MAG: triose-phosphate isomerase [Candidatus Xiphinematobacter sp.]